MTVDGGRAGGERCAEPNKGMELTAYSSSSCPAFGTAPVHATEEESIGRCSRYHTGHYLEGRFL